MPSPARPAPHQSETSHGWAPLTAEAGVTSASKSGCAASAKQGTRSVCPRENLAMTRQLQGAGTFDLTQAQASAHPGQWAWRGEQGGGRDPFLSAGSRVSGALCPRALAPWPFAPWPLARWPQRLRGATVAKSGSLWFFPSRGFLRLQCVLLKQQLLFYWHFCTVAPCASYYSIPR